MTAVETLEREFAAKMGAQAAVAAGYGRGALLLALETVDVSRADVAVPNFICAQVPEAVRRAGARPIFYPVGGDLRIDADDFHEALTPECRVAIVAHCFGRRHANLAELAEICRRRSIALIEDCALALRAAGGATGDLAVYSFTKSDWCYGGGMVTTGVRDWVARLRRLRDEKFYAAERMARCYGWLRRADFAANRPSRAGLAEFAGRRMQEFFARGEPALRDANFYDAAPFDAVMPEFAARRALRILSGLRDGVEQRRLRAKAIVAALGGNGWLRAHESQDAGDGNGAFLCVTRRDDASETAEQIVARAARAGVTLRRCWPAYQELQPGQASDDLRWLAEHLLLLEIHPQLTQREVATIAKVLNGDIE